MVLLIIPLLDSRRREREEGENMGAISHSRIKAEISGSGSRVTHKIQFPCYNLAGAGWSCLMRSKVVDKFFWGRTWRWQAVVGRQGR